MLDPGWLRSKVGSGVVTTICMCYERRPALLLFHEYTSLRLISLGVQGEKGIRLLNLWTLVLGIFLKVIP